MRSLWQIFWLELLALGRGGTAAILLALAFGWVLAAPHLIVADGTAEGARSLLIQYGLGGVFVLLMVSLLAAATGSIAAEREAKRLQLTQVRPVSGMVVFLGKYLALLFTGAVVLATAAVLILAKTGDVSRPCSHVLRPVMESPRSEAEKAYEGYMQSPDTPKEVKQAKREAVIRLLEQRARDRYETVRTNQLARWSFAPVTATNLAVRLHFSGQFNLRETVCGEVALGAAKGRVDGQSQTTLIAPLIGAADGRELTFVNLGPAPLQFRPRQDVELLIPADGFGWNLLRATLELLAVLAATIAFGLFLGAALSRPVAMFTAMVLLLIGELGPSVAEQYPDQLETNRIDRLGLMISRAVAGVTQPFSQLTPIDSLIADDCVEMREMMEALAGNAVLLPLVFALLAGLSPQFSRSQVPRPPSQVASLKS